MAQAMPFLWFVGVPRDRLGAGEDRFFATVFLRRSDAFDAVPRGGRRLLVRSSSHFMPLPDVLLHFPAHFTSDAAGPNDQTFTS
jgi:hypothetical protein